MNVMKNIGESEYDQNTWNLKLKDLIKNEKETQKYINFKDIGLKRKRVGNGKEYKFECLQMSTWGLPSDL